MCIFLHSFFIQNSKLNLSHNPIGPQATLAPAWPVVLESSKLPKPKSSSSA